jgi:hypothetical protein
LKDIKQLFHKKQSFMSFKRIYKVRPTVAELLKESIVSLVGHDTDTAAMLLYSRKQPAVAGWVMSYEVKQAQEMAVPGAPSAARSYWRVFFHHQMRSTAFVCTFNDLLL